MISTTYCETPWSTGELAALHGTNPARAKRKQDELDCFIIEILAPAYVKRNTRADQAAVSIRATVARLHRLFVGDERTIKHITHLIKLAYDRTAEQRLDAAAKRLPAVSHQLRKTAFSQSANRRSA